MSSTQEEVQKELQDYLTAKGINNLFIKVVEELLLQKPDNPVQFIVDHLRENYPQQLLGGGGSGSGDVMSSVANDADDLGDLSSDYESEEDELAEMKPLKVIKRTRRRTAISAPSFNPQDFDASNKKVFDKKDEEKARIKDILSRNLLFKNCGPDQMESLVDAFQPMNFDDGGIIIAQGDPVGEHFYLLEEGAADVYVSSKGEEHKVLAYESGSGAAFGELSLMYNAPRAATVKAKGATKVWALDRTTFKMVVTGAAIAQRQKRAQFVENVSILESLTAKEKLGVADALRERHVNAHQMIIRQGDKGDDFFIIEDGEVVCTQQAEADSPPKEVLRLKSGAYFGEIALLTNRARQATVTAVRPTKLLVLDRRTFKRTMGPLTEILKRNMDQYNTFVGQQM